MHGWSNQYTYIIITIMYGSLNVVWRLRDCESGAISNYGGGGDDIKTV